LRLGKRDRIRYSVQANGDVLLTRADARQEEDPALLAFLSFLAQDMTQHPERLQGLNEAVVSRLRNLVGEIDPNLDEALPDDAE
jgi:antitoxin PrlF